MDLMRIGEKVVSRDKLNRAIDRILQLRADGASQQDAAQELGVDRSFISRLEGMGEVRKGGRIALIGFPLANKDEILRVGEEEGCDFMLLMTNSERWKWVGKESGVELLNEAMALIAKVKEFDSIVLIGSDMRIRLVEAVTGKDVVAVSLGESPVTEDRRVEPEVIRAIIRSLKG